MIKKRVVKQMFLLYNFLIREVKTQESNIILCKTVGYRVNSKKQQNLENVLIAYI